MAIDQSTTKLCSKCKTEKAAAEFRADPKMASGLSSQCRACGRIRAQAWKERNRERTRVYARDYAAKHPETVKENERRRTERRRIRKQAEPPKPQKPIPDKQKCTSCSRVLPLSGFYRDKSRRAGVTNLCRECSMAVAAEWHRKNPERASKARAAYYLSNTEKSLLDAKKWRAANREACRSFSRRRRARDVSAEGSHTAEEVAAIRKAQRSRCGACGVRVRPGGGHMDHIIALINGGSNYARNLQLLCNTCNTRKNRKDPILFMQSLGKLL